MSLRYGLIGAGMMGQEHIRNLKLLDNCAITAIADPDPKMRTKAMQIAGGQVQEFDDYRKLLSANNYDALIIATPNWTHRQVLLDSLPGNKPILCEKPLCTTVTDCLTVRQSAERHAAAVWVAMEYRYMPALQRLLAEIEAGTAGTPRMISIREHRFPFLEKVGNWNRFHARTGGTLVEKCCHFWDLMRAALKSNPVRVFASAGIDVNHLDECYDGQTPDMIDNGFVVVDFENGARGMLDLCMFAEASPWQEVVTVTGDNARIEARIPGPPRMNWNGKEQVSEIEVADRINQSVVVEQVELDPVIAAAGDHHGSTYYQHRRFQRIVENGGTVDVSLEDGQWSVLVGEAAEQSARTGQAVELSALQR